MLILAVSELDMKPDEFWDLTWYDWGLYVIKYNTMIERERLKQEEKWVHTRALMALIANVNRDPKKKAFKPQDFIKLSFDKEEKEDRPLTVKEMKERLGGKFKKDGN